MKRKVGAAWMNKQLDEHVVQEYERTVIFRLGRLVHGGSKGPGIFFILPCIENCTTVDLRTLTFDVPPQEVSNLTSSINTKQKNSLNICKRCFFVYLELTATCDLPTMCTETSLYYMCIGLAWPSA
ncbi:uncharacterized protein LOC143236704 isoform X2 [Tachypleus tridentatus]|uniref:uncharacterized protein LOC143236704 isoform X2 n=1 Tax=Tachypleus tridentatus TaxID=6853 RepID=UPI003FD051D9